MKRYFKVLFLVLIFNSQAQVSVCTWNIMNLGKSKSQSELYFMAITLSKYDVVAIQEVVAGEGGAQAVAKLASILQTKGEKWNYVISNPTTSTNKASKERYAFLWKIAKVTQIGKGWLDQNYQKEIDREPFMSTFQYDKKRFTLVSFHAVPKKKNPASEIKYFKFYPNLYPNLNLIFLGDFNCSQSHTVFNPLKKMGYMPVFTNQKTSLRQKCKNKDCLASEYDNIFYAPSKISCLSKGVNSFYTSFSTLKEARKISDHIPVWSVFKLK